MKHNTRFNLFSFFAGAVMLLITACQLDPLNKMTEDEKDHVAVSFKILPESLPSIATRAEEVQIQHISDGTKADFLVYAVYQKEGDKWTLQPEFGLKEMNPDDDGKFPNGQNIGRGQNFVSGQNRPWEITLRLKRNETYRVAFWAQSSKCNAYVIDNLEQVRVRYAEFESPDSELSDGTASTSTPNNDELRDAFCRVKELKIDTKPVEPQTIYLYRPLAQINVGTTGYDYESVVQDQEIMQYAYTRIQITNVARYLDVVNDCISTGNMDESSVVEFGWAPIPAYINCQSVPADKTSTVEGEEFLKVHLYDGVNPDEEDKEEKDKEYMPKGDDGYFGYCGYDYAKAYGEKKTETFKYLSMCYVLVPSENRADVGETPKYSTTTLGRVRVWIATDAEGNGAKSLFDLANVHATRNWRTNIVGNLLTTDVDFHVKLDPIYAGDYNGDYEDGNVSWSGPLNGDDGGVFYDAESDEILISNVNGLLWFQQMVNGNLVYTADNKNTKTGANAEVGKPIAYYLPDGSDHTFSGDDPDFKAYFKGIDDPLKDLLPTDPEYKKAKELHDRIMRATHQDKNENNVWPANNNFHFVGGKKYDDPARVKLVADIDLSGIEWLSIGFDCRTDQAGDMLADNNDQKSPEETTNEVTAKKQINDKTLHRGFFGNFDGNGHTISNLTTKRFSLKVHQNSMQLDNAGPYDAVQWYARGFFGQVGGKALIQKLTLRNVDIYGNHCVGGIVGAVLGTYAPDKTGTVINIENCHVDGGSIVNEPMYRGDGYGSKDRTFARGIYTGGIVGMYNASGSVTGCEVSNLTIRAYRQLGGIVGAVTHFYGADRKLNFSGRNAPSSKEGVKPKSIEGNSIRSTVIIGDHFKPFDVMANVGTKMTDDGFVDGSYRAEWAYGYSWNVSYSSFCSLYVGGEESEQQEKNPGDIYHPTYYGKNDFDNVKIIDYKCDYKFEEGSSTRIAGRKVEIIEATVDVLPILNNWFVDYVILGSNLLGEATAYKRYFTTPFCFTPVTSPQERANAPWNLPNTFDYKWDTSSGKVGMRLGAVDLEGNDFVLSVRGVEGEKDCAMQISSCDRNVFKGNTKKPAWYTSASTTVRNMEVRGNPYAYTGICLSPNGCMNAITIEDVSIFDVGHTIALDDDLKEKGDNVWPKKVDPTGVTLTVRRSNLRGYTTPGEGWNSVIYEAVIFESGAYVKSDLPKNICEVDATEKGTTFTDCTFKAPYIVNAAEGTTFELKGECTAFYAGVSTPIEPGKYTRIEIGETGTVSTVVAE